MGNAPDRLDLPNTSQETDAISNGIRQRNHTNVLFLIDASGSMHGQKMKQAIKAVEDAAETLPSSCKVGLRVFGENEPTMKMCHNSRLLVPLGRNTIEQIYNNLDQIACTIPDDPEDPSGWFNGDSSKSIQLGPDTPTAFALQEAWDKDFAHGDGPNEVFLITDGVWTCKKNPCAVLEVINKDGIHMKVDVVSLNGADDNKLKCITENAGGKLLHKDDLSDFSQAFGQFVNESLYGEVRQGKKTPSTSVQGNDHDKAHCHCHDRSHINSITEPATKQAGQ